MDTETVMQMIKDHEDHRLSSNFYTTHAILGTGKLYIDPSVLAVFEADRNKIIKVIYSYATPIAWMVEGGEWKLITSEKFSHTTRKQIRWVQGVLGLLGSNVTEI